MKPTGYATYISTVVAGAHPALRSGWYRFMLLFFALMPFTSAYATHIVGGEVSYTYMGGNSYQVNLTIYEDCLNGTATAIAADDTAFIAVFKGSTQLQLDSIGYQFSIAVPSNFNNECVTNIPAVCLRKKNFVFNLTLPPNGTGYTVAYQRCCRNGLLQTITDPANSGATYFCTIPPLSVARANNSAIFTNFPPQIICVNTPLIYNNSATDPDNDSLSYDLCTSYFAPNSLPNDSITPPPFSPATYTPAFRLQPLCHPTHSFR